MRRVGYNRDVDVNYEMAQGQTLVIEEGLINEFVGSRLVIRATNPTRSNTSITEVTVGKDIAPIVALSGLRGRHPVVQVSTRVDGSSYFIELNSPENYPLDVVVSRYCFRT